MAIQSITPFLWFNTEAEAAANFYVSLFENSRILQISHYGDAGPLPKGSVMVVALELMGRQFSLMNAGPSFKLDEAFSLTVNCTEQADIDRLWQALGEGGNHNVCGWLKDKFGLSWQINYAGLPDLLLGDAERANRVLQAMYQMGEIDIQALKDAAGKS